MAYALTSQAASMRPLTKPFRADPLVGLTFNNRFRIHSLLAVGGMGKVYRAVQVPLGRVVALKVLQNRYSLSDETDAHQHDSFHRRFFLEAAIAARLTHPNTVVVFDYGQSDTGIYYMAMEFLSGVPLRDALACGQAFAPSRALHIAVQIGRALREAHRLGAVHRDLKPANVFLLQRDDMVDFVKVLDFGLVKHVNRPSDKITQPGKFLGSPGYMAPEQIRGEVLDKRCDIYALGVLLFEMLTGRPPFLRGNVYETHMAHVHDPVPSLAEVCPGVSVAKELERVVMGCLAKRPEHRFASMDHVLQILEGQQRSMLHDFQGSAGKLADGRGPQQYLYGTPLRRPVSLDEEEKSGWTVVSSTGVLAQSILEDPATELMDALPYGTSVNKKTLRMAVLLSMLVLLPYGVACFRQILTYYAGRNLRQSQVTLWLESKPQGAAVYQGQELLCAKTPCQLNWSSVALPVGRVLNMHFVLPKHDDYIVSRAISNNDVHINVELHPTSRHLHPGHNNFD